MRRKELEKKYGKKLINYIFRNGYLEGCTMGILENGEYDIYECDIIDAIKEMKGISYYWD